MSMEFPLAGDDNIQSTLRRHLRLTSWIEAVRVAAFIVLTLISILGATANMRGVAARSVGSQQSRPQVVAPGGETRLVTLDANPRYFDVQLFDGMQATSKVVATLPVGTRCSALEAPHSTTLHSTTTTFFHLDCDGTVGYVDAKWVRVNE